MNQNQRKALKAFLSQETSNISEVAAKSGLTRPTIYAYLSDPEFKAALNQQQDAIIALATARLARLLEKALDGLESVLDNPTQEGAGNLRLSAKDTLKILDQFTDRTLDERLAALEKKVFEN